jgi:hypothetical protein
MSTFLATCEVNVVRIMTPTPQAQLVILPLNQS